MRRSLTLLATVAILIGLVAGPAAADKPTHVSDTLGEWVNGFLGLDDPCNEGESLGGYNIVLEGRIHEGHAKNFVGILKGSGTTDNGGYVMSGSPDHVMVKYGPDGGIYIEGFSDTWYSPETGDRFRMTSMFMEKDGKFASISSGPGAWAVHQRLLLNRPY
jgi:hypothetical protein